MIIVGRGVGFKDWVVVNVNIKLGRWIYKGRKRGWNCLRRKIEVLCFGKSDRELVIVVKCWGCLYKVVEVWIVIAEVEGRWGK